MGGERREGGRGEAGGRAGRGGREGGLEPSDVRKAQARIVKPSPRSQPRPWPWDKNEQVSLENTRFYPDLPQNRICTQLSGVRSSQILETD